jgi:predicted Zn-dependent peptidase
VANAPYGMANLHLFTQPLASYKPYALPVIGSVEDLNSAPFEEVKAFHDKYYKPNNATLVVVGAINIEQAEALIQAYFADIPAGENVPSILSQYPPPAQFPSTGKDEITGCLLGTEETLVDPLAGLPRWAMSIAGPLRGTPDYYALDVLSMVLSSGNSSRLERDIVQQGKAAAAFVGLTSYLGASVFYGAVYPNSGGDLEGMPALLLAELDKVRADGVTDVELARAKRQLVTGSISSYRGSVRETAEWLQDATLAFGSPAGIVEELEAYQAVTAADVQRAAQSYLCARPMNVQRVLTGGDQAQTPGADQGASVTATAESGVTASVTSSITSAVTSAVTSGITSTITSTITLTVTPTVTPTDAVSVTTGITSRVTATDVVTAAATITPTATTTMTEKPEPLVLPATAIADLPPGTVTDSEVPAPLGDATTDFPPFVTFKLDNGLNVIFVEQHEVPKVQLQLVVGGSEKQAPEDQQGIADLMTMLLTKGTVKKSADTIAARIEDVGGSISASAALEWTTVSADALTTDTKLVFDLLSEVARYSVFPQSELDVAKTQTLSSLQLDATNPDSLADHEFGRVAFAGHPYSYVETQETVKNLTRDDIRTFYRTYYRPNNALLIIVGDLTAEEAKAQAERAFGLWMPAEVPGLFDYPEPQPADTSVIYLVDRPDSEQATIQIGNVAIDARNPDRYALEVVNSLLGGGSSSRLFRNLREDKGYTYGVYSRFARPNDNGTFRVIGDFNQESAGAAVEEILKELANVRTEPIQPEELENAKSQLVGSFALAMEDPSVFASQLAVRALTGVPIEELNDYLPALEAVTAEQAHEAAAKYINSDAPIIIVVGNADVLEPQLEKIMPVRVVDSDGNPVEK